MGIIERLTSSITWRTTSHPPRMTTSVTGPTECPVAMPQAQQQITHNRAKRVAEYAQAHALRQQGWTMKAISTPMGRHHRTVRKYLEASTFPERPPRRRPPSILDPYKAYSARALAGRVSQCPGAVSRDASAGVCREVQYRGGLCQPLASASRTDHQTPQVGITRDNR